MSKHHPVSKHVFQVDDLAAIRMVFQRLCRAGGEVHLQIDGKDWAFPIFEEVEGRVMLGITEAERNKWKMGIGDHYRLTVFDRGRKLQGTCEVAEFVKVEETPCVAMEQPRVLKGRDNRGLVDFIPEKPYRAVFTSPAMDFCEARIKTMGSEGIQLPLYGENSVKEGQLKLDTPTTLELALELGTKFVFPANTEIMEEGVAGIRFTVKHDSQELRDYRHWLSDARNAQDRKDREVFRSGGIRAERRKGAVINVQPTLQVLVEKDPLVLIISEPPFSQRMAEAVGRKFGVAGLDYARGELVSLLKPLGVEGADWGPVKLVLVHQRLKSMSGMEVAAKLLTEPGCPPVLVVGPEEAAETKRERALAMGAVGFLVVDPFKILAVIQALDQALKTV